MIRKEFSLGKYDVVIILYSKPIIGYIDTNRRSDCRTIDIALKNLFDLHIGIYNLTFKE